MVPLDRATLQRLREAHPAWRLLASAHAPFTLSFLHHAFIASNTRTVVQGTLAALLDEHLQDARTAGIELPKSAEAYLDDWADSSSGWLRKFYASSSDEPFFDLTPPGERAVQWVARLLERRFVGTQSRLLTVFQLLTEIIEGSEANPDLRLAELTKRRDQLDAEIAKLKAGQVDLLDPRALREKFQQMASTARDLLSDFRELDHSFQTLDREVRKKIATWQGGRGELLEGILGDRDALTASDQGTSFRAFWDFLMSSARQEELSEKLKHVLGLDAVRELAPDPRLRRIHFDWLAAGDITQRTVARLSEQLRRYVDDRVWLENRRIMTLIRGIEQQALLLSDGPPDGVVAEIDALAPLFGLPLERPLFQPPFVASLDEVPVELGKNDDPANALFEQVAVDRRRLLDNINKVVAAKGQASLGDVIATHPLQHGLAELVTYFAVAAEYPRAVIDERTSQDIAWAVNDEARRSATVPLVLFNR